MQLQELISEAFVSYKERVELMTLCTRCQDCLRLESSQVLLVQMEINSPENLHFHMNDTSITVAIHNNNIYCPSF